MPKQRADVLTGDRELDRLLASVEAKKVKPALRKGAREGAKETAAQAKANVPTDSGALKRSIKVRALKRSRKTKHLVGARVVTGEGLFKGDNYYGGFVEFGTSKMKAKPYLRPAANQSKQRVFQAFKRKTAEAIRSVK